MKISEGKATTRSLLEAVESSLERGRQYMLGIQHADGYWWGELESNPTMEAEYLLLTHFLGVAERGRWRKIVNHILRKQREDGSWGQYFGGPGDLSTSVECYFALKLAGVSPDQPPLVKARRFILSKGGVPKVRIFTKIWLALFGQWDWRGVPIMPPELMLAPNWSPVNIYEFSSWARATIVPMLIILTKRPVCPIPPEAAIDELYPRPRSETDYSLPPPKELIGWRRFFFMADKVLRVYHSLPWHPGRGLAMRRAEEWVLSHQEADGSWGGIQPPWVYSLIALKVLGHPLDHPAIVKGLRGFETFAIEDGDTWRLQACVSPVWDTCLALIGLMDAGLPADHPAVQRATRWLLSQEIRVGGDWQVKNPRTPPGGWAFEFENDIYPDIDDTAEVVLALLAARLPAAEEGEKQAAIDRAVRWVLSMQCRNGGWAAFDVDNTKGFLTKIPFCDFGETVDPPSEDVTAHVIEMLGRLGYTSTHPAVARALAYLKREQEHDGCWFGRWGVNYVYGTGAVLPALATVGEDMSQPYVRRAVAWLVAHQNSDGGWGESCASYADPSLRGIGVSTASQTAWALLALLAAGEARSEAVQRGVRFLVETQRDAGDWDEPQFTGTGFPGYGVGRRLGHAPTHQGVELAAGFMINYHLYRNYWPLMALGRFRRTMKGTA